MENEMKKLDAFELDNIGGGYLRLNTDIVSIEALPKPLKGGILYPFTIPISHKEKIFPAPNAWRD